MNPNFDLNINNYRKQELIDMFELPPNYDKNIVEIKESKLRDSIINNNEINQDIKIKTINFLAEAKNILCETVYSEVNNIKNSINKFNSHNIYHTNYDLKSTKIEDKNEHMVQVRTEYPYVTSKPQEFFSGIINPLSRTSNKYFLNIDTRFRTDYYNSQSTNFNITLPTQFNDVLTMQLDSIELPLTFYNISKQYGNNFFTIDASGSSEVISIPDGNYTFDGILTILNNSMTTLGGLFSNILFTIDNTNSNGSGRMIVGLKSGSPLFNFTLNFQANKFGIEDRNTPLPLKLGWIFGFRNGIYVNNSVYISEGLVDLNTFRYLYLVIDDHNNNVSNNYFSAFTNSVLNKNILARISLQADTYTVLLQNNLNIITSPRRYFGPVNIQNMNIQILDEYGRIVDLNNMDLSFCLSLQTSYDV
jgi:hypothetical protein